MANATPVTAASGGQTTPVIVVTSGPATPIENVLAQGTPIAVVASGPATPVMYSNPVYDFGSGMLPVGVTFTRASAAWGFNSAGVLTAYATNEPRFVYDPVTLVPLGLLIEGVRTNSVRNSTCIGAVPGTPGTLPTRWAIESAIGGITRTLVGVGVEDDIDYVDIRWFGTPDSTATRGLIFEVSTQTAASETQVWTGAVFIRLVGGSLAGATYNMVVSGRTSGGSGTSAGSVAVTPTAAPLRTQRWQRTLTLAGATTAGVDVDFRINYVIATPIDFTLRIGLPQLELGVHASSPVKTSTVAVTRADDIANIIDARVLTDACYIVRGRAPSYTSAFSMVALQVDDGTTANVKSFTRNVSSQITLNATAASAATAFPVAGTTVVNQDFAVAGRWGTNDFSVSLNGAASVLDTVGASPVGLTTARIGRAVSGGNNWNSTIKSIETRATASDAELQALSRLTPEGTYDFSADAMPTGLSFTRASTAWGLDRNGTLQSYATNEPRFVYDPVTLQNLGLLIEGARTNSIRNNTMVGTVAGTPGTTPNLWSSSTGSVNGLTRTIAVGVEDGIEYIDFAYSGTPSASGAVFIINDGAQIAAAVNGQVWTGSYFLRLVAGSLGNLASKDIYVTENNAAGSGLVSGAVTFTATSAPLRTQRQALTRTLSNASTAFTQSFIRIDYTIALPVDFTLRIGLPQLELGYHASSPIKTSTAAAVRAVDLANITDARTLTDLAVIAKGRVANALPTGLNQHLFTRDTGADVTSQKSYRDQTPTMFVRVDNGGSQAMLNIGAPTNNTDMAVAARFAQNDVAGSLNGGAVMTDTVANLFVPTTFRIGRGASLGVEWNSTIKSIETRATASDAELQNLSVVLAAFDGDAVSWSQRVVANGGTVSTARLGLVSTFIIAEKAAGTWWLTDDYWLFWGENEIQALTSLKQQRLGVNIGNTLFIPNRCYSFRDLVNYIDTGFIANSHKVAMLFNNCRAAVYILNNFDSSGYPLGVNTDSTKVISIRPRNQGVNTRVAAGWNFTGFTLPAPANSQGFTVAARDGDVLGTNTRGYKNGVELMAVAIAPTGMGASLPTHSIFLGMLNNAGTPSQFCAHELALACVGASLTPAQEVLQYNNVQAFATAIGVNV